MTDSPVWLVTGASKGIGLEVVKAALASGARVAATTRSPEKLSAELRDPNLLALAVDLTDEHDVRRAVAQVQTEFRHIDVLVNNAGYSLLGAVEEVSPADVRANFDINVFGVLAMIRAVLPGMRDRGTGRILNLSSISASVTGPAQGISRRSARAACAPTSSTPRPPAAPRSRSRVTTGWPARSRPWTGSTTTRVATRYDWPMPSCRSPPCPIRPPASTWEAMRSRRSRTSRTRSAPVRSATPT